MPSSAARAASASAASEPLLDLVLPDGPRVSYGNMTPEKTRAIARRPTPQRRPPAGPGPWAASTARNMVSTGEVRTYPAGPAELQRRAASGRRSISIAARRRSSCATAARSIPMSLDETIARGTYRGAFRALAQMKPDAVIDEVVQSGLRGRGGAAFPTGQKWRLARQAAADLKYVVCNADEGEPGAYMDRTVLEGDPHAVLEGMLIGAYAIGATRRFHLRPQRVSAGHRDPRTRHRRGREARAAGREHLRHAAGRSASRSAAGRGPTSAARKRP